MAQAPFCSFLRTPSLQAELLANDAHGKAAAAGAAGDGNNKVGWRGSAEGAKDGGGGWGGAATHGKSLLVVFTPSPLSSLALYAFFLPRP